MISKQIYIPIWFYSNGERGTMRAVLAVFTFQYGSIQIKLPLLILMSLNLFTFQYGSIQIPASILHPQSAPTFTFQYGSIQIQYAICR